MRSREGCCAYWPKPCTYHEGFQDGVDDEEARYEQVGEGWLRSEWSNCDHAGTEPEPVFRKLPSPEEG